MPLDPFRQRSVITILVVEHWWPRRLNTRDRLKQGRGVVTWILSAITKIPENLFSLRHFIKHLPCTHSSSSSSSSSSSVSGKLISSFNQLRLCYNTSQSDFVSWLCRLVELHLTSLTLNNHMLSFKLRDLVFFILSNLIILLGSICISNYLLWST
ncbi:hypothetical protein QVD17_04812 [Tagetes erecta]|uniref:Uncharacterized protein n=1 Tax=Tagetes erecta TaxID=13708 RepID=A0AAD8LCM1_TARER|nr:hypothetical protein QVD17_04812 [Tagetes erecta]